MSVRIKDTQTDQAHCTHDSCHNAQCRQRLLRQARVGHQSASSAEPLFRKEGNVEEDGGNDGAGDEKWFELVGAYVADISDALRRFHRGIVWTAGGEPVD